MQDERITYSRSVKINLGNYQSTDVHISMGANVETDADGFEIETPQEVYRELRRRVLECLAREVASLDEDPGVYGLPLVGPRAAPPAEAALAGTAGSIDLKPADANQFEKAVEDILSTVGQGDEHDDTDTPGQARADAHRDA